MTVETNKFEDNEKRHGEVSMLKSFVRCTTGWQHDRPTMDGYYWMQKMTSCAGPVIVDIRSIGALTFVYRIGVAQLPFLEDLIFNEMRWIGPIEEPGCI